MPSTPARWDSARATAAIIGKAIGMQPVPFEDLREMDFGWMEGGRLFNFAKDPPLVRRLRSAWISTVVRLSGEPRSRFGERVAGAGREIARRHPDQHVLAVIHMAVRSNMLARLLDGDPSAWVRYDAWPAGAFTEIEVSADGKARLIDLNVNAHFKPTKELIMTENQPINWEQTLFAIILHAGNARCKALEAAEMGQEGDFSGAEAALREADVEQAEAHKVHARVIQMEAGGEQVPFSVLLVHSMDLLLLSWAEIDHTRQLLELFKRVSALEKAAVEIISEVNK